jgi:hypothetical protein
MKEALGQTSGKSEYVYLSDGGHFENLGLYEMVRRRCKTIIVFDGACDADFQMSDLGNALRKIRIDLRIAIDFGEQERLLRARSKRCAIGTVRYSVVDGQRLDWEDKDVFCVPGWAFHEHVNTGKPPAILFSHTDVPVMRSLGLYREEAHPADRQ